MVGLLGMAACLRKPDVRTKVPEGVRLEQYKTYAFHSGKLYDFESETISTNADVGKALEADVRAELERRGLKAADINPDLTFTYSAAKRLEHAGERAWPYYEGAIDLIATDIAGRKVWSSHLQAILNPKDKTHQRLKEAIGRAFKNYPSVAR